MGQPADNGKKDGVSRAALWRKAFILVLPVALFAWGLSASWEVNGRYPRDEWRSDLRADAAGYYVYLPALFQYGFSGIAMDSSLLDLTGHGFELDDRTRMIRTKYTYGTALLQAPFYLVAETVAGWGRTDGFTDTHRRWIEVAAVFYWVAGLCFLGLALMRWRPVPLMAALLVLAGISFGSNVLFYAVRMPGFSHIHSFFVVCVAVWALVTGVVGGTSTVRRWVFHFCCALLLLIRPMDIIAVMGLYVWLFIRDRSVLARTGFWAAQAVALAVIALPQLLYWKHVFGMWFMDSYAGEGFVHWDAPRVSCVLFAAKNSLLLYSPVLLLMPLGLRVLWREDRRTVAMHIGIWAVLVYACGSWWSWGFGCAFGCRPAVQYMPFAAFAIMPFFGRTDTWGVRWRFAVVPVLCLLLFAHLRATMQVIPCFAGTDDWDYDWYVANYIKAFFGDLPAL
jgi:hypothetical protein